MQALVALLLGILLFAVPLYLWRRPRPGRPATAATSEPASVPAVTAPLPAVQESAPEVAPPPPAVALSEAHVMECHDQGARRTPPAQCDSLPEFAKALAGAVTESAECVPNDAAGGTIVYVADVSFARRRSPVTITAPSDGRSLRSGKVAKDCLARVRARLTSLTLGSIEHAHSRYKLSLVATYARSRG